MKLGLRVPECNLDLYKYTDILLLDISTPFPNLDVLQNKEVWAYYTPNLTQEQLQKHNVSVILIHTPERVRRNSLLVIEALKDLKAKGITSGTCAIWRGEKTELQLLASICTYVALPWNKLRDRYIKDYTNLSQFVFWGFRTLDELSRCPVYAVFSYLPISAAMGDIDIGTRERRPRVPEDFQPKIVLPSYVEDRIATNVRLIKSI